MLKALPYIIITISLLVAGGIYLQFSDSSGNAVSILPSENKSAESINAEKEVDGEKKLLRNEGPAPELRGLQEWFNSNPTTLEELRGQVVLLDFWTYSCINCVRTLPFVTKWHETYKDQGFTVLGIHTPEFAFEKVAGNVQTAIERHNITYPVAQDNNYRTWSAFNNRFWPAHYLIDQNGNIMYTHFGEGAYDETELAIRTLLGLEGEFDSPPTPEANQSKTKEIYFGLARLEAFGGSDRPSSSSQIYTFPKQLRDNRFALEGEWLFHEEEVTLLSDTGRIRLNFNAAKVFMVAESPNPTNLKISVDGEPHKGVVVKDSELYPLVDLPEGGEHILEIEIDKPGLKAFTFTFG